MASSSAMMTHLDLASTSPESAPSKPPGSRVKLSSLKVLKTIGTGTFARVHLCQSRSEEREFFALKILSAGDVIRLKQVEHVKNEKAILNEVSHPFLVPLLDWTKDEKNLYMVFPFVPGGELFSHLRSTGRFTVPQAQFYSVEIVAALEYLHSLSIVYRDLKPENLLLDKTGHLKIVDFGFAKKVSDARTWTLCGTPEYLAPEIIQSKGHNLAVDWWALGILVFEMLAGYPPFFDDNPFGIYEKILGGKIEWPRHIDPVAKDLVKKLLAQDRTKRLGCLKNGAEDVKRHRWFKAINWAEDVVTRRLKPPILPRLSHDGDTRYYDSYPEVAAGGAAVSEKEMRLFDDF